MARRRRVGGSAAAFRREAQQVVLPDSGQVVLVRKPNVVDMVMGAGEDAPAPMTASIIASLGMDESFREHAVTPADLPVMNNFIRQLVVSMLEWPRVVPEDSEPDYEAGQIAWSDLSFPDVEFLFGIAMEDVNRGQKFPEEQEASLESVSAGKNLAQ